MAKKKTYSEFGFTLQVTNNTNATQLLDILGNPANLLDTANATTEYQWDVTGITPTNFVTLEYMPVGGSSFSLYTANMSSGVPGLVAALNGLGIGYFYSSTVGGNTYVSTYNDKYVFGNIDVQQALQFAWAFTNNSAKTIIMSGGSLSGTINWGDGTTSAIAGTVSHAYSSQGSYNVTFVYDGSLDFLDLSNNLLTTFNPTILPSEIFNFNLAGNQLTSFNPTVALPSGLQYLDLSNNLLASFNPTIALPAGLLSINLLTNQLTVFNPSIALPTGLQSLTLTNNQLTSFNPTIPLPSGLQDLFFDANNLATPAVNTSLIYLNSIGYSTPFVAILTQNIAATPSGAGIVAKNNLISRGCTIVTD